MKDQFVTLQFVTVLRATLRFSPFQKGNIYTLRTKREQTETLVFMCILALGRVVGFARLFIGS